MRFFTLLSLFGFVTLTVSTEAKDFYDICDQIHGALGFPCEHHPVLTDDGFVLDVLRIPYRASHVANASDDAKGYPILLQHGLLDTAATWVANALPSQNFGTMLAMRGYDVWLGNSRGNHYSMDNLQHPNQASTVYWRSIDMDGMAKYDLPAMIHHILNRTQRSSMSYAGHSQGCWTAFAAFSTLHPRLAKSVDLFVALAPATYVGHVQSLIIDLLADMDVAQILQLLGEKEFLNNDWLLRQAAKLCPYVDWLCVDGLSLILGPSNASNTDPNLFPIITRYTPGGTSVFNMLHWAQAVKSGTYGMHDYGEAENLKIYGTPTAPLFNLTNMRGPRTVVASGGEDALADPTDVAHMLNELAPTGVVADHLTLATYEHLDFVWGLDAHTVLYPWALRHLAAARRP